jgi:hypothetical protein
MFNFCYCDPLKVLISKMHLDLDLTFFIKLLTLIARGTAKY